MNHICTMETHRFLVFLVDWEKGVILRKNAIIMRKIINKTYRKNWFIIHFHILCANFRKIGWKIKKKANLATTPLTQVGLRTRLLSPSSMTSERSSKQHRGVFSVPCRQRKKPPSHYKFISEMTFLHVPLFCFTF